MKPDAIAFEDAIVHVRCIAQMLTLMGEGLHNPRDQTGAAFIRLGQDLTDASEKLNQVLDDLLISQRTAKTHAA